MHVGEVACVSLSVLLVLFVLSLAQGGDAGQVVGKATPEPLCPSHG